MGDELGDHIEFGTFFHQPCRGQQIGRGGGEMGQRAGIFVDAESKYGRFLGLISRSSFLEDVDQEGGGGAEVLDDFELALQITAVLQMMIVEMELNPGIVQALFKWADSIG